MKSLVRLPFVLFLLTFLVLPAFSQNSTNSRDGGPLPRAANPPRATATHGGEEAEGDDATARSLWDLRQNGVPTAGEDDRAARGERLGEVDGAASDQP